jgi:hypothetical protein
MDAGGALDTTCQVCDKFYLLRGCIGQPVLETMAKFEHFLKNSGFTALPSVKSEKKGSGEQRKIYFADNNEGSMSSPRRSSPFFMSIRTLQNAYMARPK